MLTLAEEDKAISRATSHIGYCSTNGLKRAESVVKEITRNNWTVRGGSVTRRMHMLVTTRVVQEARKHFGCDSLEGAELEDYDGFNHWEARVFGNEAMTGARSGRMVMSRITFALLEDSGWYKPNYSMAEDCCSLAKI